MKLLLWFVYQITKMYPLGFLLAAGKALKWDVTYDSDGENVKSIEFAKPEEGE